MVSIQILERLEKLHKLGYIYDNFLLSNIMIGNNI